MFRTEVGSYPSHAVRDNLRTRNKLHGSHSDIECGGMRRLQATLPLLASLAFCPRSRNSESSFWRRMPMWYYPQQTSDEELCTFARND